MLSQTQAKTDLSRIRTAIPSAAIDIIYDGNTISTAIRVSQDIGKDYEFSGELTGYEGSLRVPTSDFATFPEVGKLITVDGTVRRILNIYRNTLRAWVRIDYGTEDS